MRNTTHWRILLIMAALASLAFTGCGGGSGGAPAGTGSVQGRIANLDTLAGVAGITVTIAGRSAVSVSPDGSFLVIGIAPGYQNITITPTASYELVGFVPPCNIIAGQTITLATIYVLPTGGGPPGPA